MSEQASDEGKVYPGNLTRWRGLNDAVEAALEAGDHEQAAVLAIREGFEGLTLVLTQIRFDAKGRGA